MSVTLLEIPHGGSGTGISYWRGWADDCLLAGDIREQGTYPRPCWAYPAMLIGTMVHELLRAWRAEELEDDGVVTFVDNQCGPPKKEHVVEAHRIYHGYTQQRTRDDLGKILALELRLGGPEVDAAVGVSPFTALLDVLVERDDGEIWIVDYKTARASMAYDAACKSYSSGLQPIAYTLAARAKGYDVKGFLIEQIVKTKEIKILQHKMPFVTKGEEILLRNFMQYASKRKDTGERAPKLTACWSCHYRIPGLCTRGRK